MANLETYAKALDPNDLDRYVRKLSFLDQMHWDKVPI